MNVLNNIDRDYQHRSHEKLSQTPDGGDVCSQGDCWKIRCIRELKWFAMAETLSISFRQARILMMNTSDASPKW